MERAVVAQRIGTARYSLTLAKKSRTKLRLLPPRWAGMGDVGDHVFERRTPRLLKKRLLEREA